MNFKVNKLYLVLLFALSPILLIGQTRERYIPIIQYEPYRFYATVMDAFYRLPNYDYVRVTDDGNEKHYYLNLGTETDGLRYFQPVSGEIDFDSDS